MQRSSGPVPPQLIEKITGDHISTILELSEKDDQRAFEDIKSGRQFTLVYVLIFCFLFVFLTIYLVSQDVELYKEILKILVVFGGGLGSGYGLKSYIDKKK